MSPIIPPTDAAYAQSLLAHPPPSEPGFIQSTISTLNLQDHIEGGYFVETDRDHLLVPNPFKNLPLLANATSKDHSETRHASTTIYYQIGQKSPVGYFHRNRGRTVHTLHRGRGRYVIMHFDQRDQNGQIPIETFVVGQDIEAGEKVQWIVEGGKFKASFLLPDSSRYDATAADGAETGSEKGLLISETVVPGFEFSDHDFLTAEGMAEALTDVQREEMRWLLKKGEQARMDQVVKQKA
ncbi:RmlC-like cupin domain-containing protein [Exophiala viscosa]|uniref:RmlC-like cupin domain-containing protein n=1 Tax=Exophiala viscosa TaxID=2486360 RepID=A0AAN6DRM7_9EURO|nr:RmlC-like cupin domain-containing protein [Exophiala viscosa]